MSDTANSTPWASCQIRKIPGCACAGECRERFSCHSMLGSLTNGFLWSRWREKHFYVSGKRPMAHKSGHACHCLNVRLLFKHINDTETQVAMIQNLSSLVAQWVVVLSTNLAFYMPYFTHKMKYRAVLLVQIWSKSYLIQCNVVYNIGLYRTVL